VSRGKAIGVLYVSSSEPCEFSERQVALLESLASQAAVVIERARQYEELKRTKGLVGARTALAWMGMTSSTWRHGIEKRALTIREQIQLLREDLRRVCSDDNQTHVDERLSMIWHLAGQILEKPITPPLSAEEGVFSVSVNGLVRERTKQLWQGEPYRSVSLRLDLTLEDRATVRASPEWLRRALDVLVDNAVDAVAGSPLQKVTIVTRQKDHRAEILVSDTGVGISEEILPELFQKPIQRPRGAKGLGMGLLMAQAIVQTYGGEISVGSTNSTGTTMLIRLPVEA
jgi:signal transduction histidine kinase